MRTFNIAKICRTPEERSQGAQDIIMADDDCYVFVFDSDRPHSFWGKNTFEDLWVCSIDDGYVTDVKQIIAFDLSPVMLEGKGSICIEFPVEVSVGSRIVFTGNTLAVYDA